VENVLTKLVVDEQKQDEWCWAAVATGIAHFYDEASQITQCNVVDLKLPRRNCCARGASLSCDLPAKLEDVLPLVRHFQPPVKPPIEPPDVKVQIQAQHPICVRVAFGTQGHFAVIKGYDDNPKFDSLQLLISDPEYGEHWHPFTIFQSAYQGKGKWTHTFLTA